jgi:hypothetical protein
VDLNVERLTSDLLPPGVWHARLRVPKGRQTKWRKAATFWIPRRYISGDDVDIKAVIDDVDGKLEARGMIHADGQILRSPLGNAGSIYLCFEGDAIYEAPSRRFWGGLQREYFGLRDPYQMGEEPDAYSQSRIHASIPEPYLDNGEEIVGLLHGGKDRRCFECPCHYASVVYTTKRRLVCMSCGATHAVLEEPLLDEVVGALTADEWSELFDDDGSQRDAEVELAIVGFQDVEHRQFIWSTSQWQESASDFVLFARSGADEIGAAIRGTEIDPSALEEAGWKPMETSPPPAFHLVDGLVDVDLMQNAEHAFVAGVGAYLASFSRPRQLLSAIPDLFRAIELILKARLEEVDSGALLSQPNNPKVLALLEKEGVEITTSQTGAIVSLRRLRNNLQHSGARFNHREGLRACRGGIVFMDQFLRSEFRIWIGDALPPESRQGLLDLPEIAETGRRVVAQRLVAIRKGTKATIEPCPRCGEASLVQLDSSTGASCMYCLHVPLNEGFDSGLMKVRWKANWRSPGLARDYHPIDPINQRRSRLPSRDGVGGTQRSAADRSGRAGLCRHRLG